jgi:hypothetical protein
MKSHSRRKAQGNAKQEKEYSRQRQQAALDTILVGQ